MNFLKNNKKIIAAFAAGAIIFSGVGYAANEYLAGNIRYTKSGESSSISVAEALNELYENKKNTSDEVKTITSNGNQTLDKYYKNLNVNVTTVPKTLLWTNSNSSSTIGAINITLNSSIDDFSHILIQYKVSTSTNDIYEDLFKTTPDRPNVNGTNKAVYMIGAWMANANATLVARPLRRSDSTTMRIGNAGGLGADPNQTSYLIPTAIYGLNFSY